MEEYSYTSTHCLGQTGPETGSLYSLSKKGDRGSTVVKVMYHKSKDRWLDPRFHNPSDLTVALGTTHPLTEMSTRIISWGKVGRCVRLKNLPPSCAVVLKSGNLNFLETSGPLQACNETDLPLHLCQRLRKAIISNCDRDLVNCISECVLNVLNGNVALTSCVKHKVSKHRLA